MSARALDFNYEHFSVALEEEELARWLRAGPKLGEPAPDFRVALSAIEAGEGPRVAESIQMVREPGRAPMGLRLLQRGGRQALLDFFESAPEPMKQRLLTAPSPRRAQGPRRGVMT